VEFLMRAGPRHRGARHPREPNEKKPDPCGPGSVCRRGADITFQRGTTTDNSVAIWEDGRQFIGSNDAIIGVQNESDNTAGRMPAMRVSQSKKCLSLLNKSHLGGFASCARCCPKTDSGFFGIVP